MNCNVISCKYQGDGKCRKPWFVRCPMTTKKNNEKVISYHRKRINKYKKNK